jgi:hypothetical protein
VRRGVFQLVSWDICTLPKEAGGIGWTDKHVKKCSSDRNFLHRLQYERIGSGPDISRNDAEEEMT